MELLLPELPEVNDVDDAEVYEEEPPVDEMLDGGREGEEALEEGEEDVGA